MPVPVEGILFLGIIPALIVLYIFLKKYEGHYSDSGVFKTFMAGIFLGAISAIVRIRLNPAPLLIIFLVLFAFFEQLLKTIILNIGRLQLKKETTIYGFSIGLGFGTVFTPFLLIAAAASTDLTDLNLILIFIGSVGIILFQGATGAYIGYGIYQGKLMKYLFISIIIQIPFNAVIDLTRLISNRYFPYYQLSLFVFGAIIFFYVITKIMPQILTKNDKNKTD